MDGNTKKEKAPKKKLNVVKVLVTFMLLCVLCSIILNVFLYKRISALKKQIKQLNHTLAVTEYYMQEADYEFV